MREKGQVIQVIGGCPGRSARVAISVGLAVVLSATVCLLVAGATIGAAHSKEDAAADHAPPLPEPPPPESPPVPGPELPTCLGKPATIIPAVGQTVVIGTPGPDVIVGRRASETISGRGGDDRICPEKGNDDVRGGTGDDRILTAGATADRIDCGPGIDSVILDPRDRQKRCERVRLLPLSP